MPYFLATGLHCLQLPRYSELTAFSFKWQPSDILNFKKFEILTARPVRRANMPQQAKFRADWSNRCGDMAVFSIFKDGGVSHLGFLKVINCNCWTYWESQYASTCQISCYCLNHCGDMAVFQSFKMAASAVLDF